MTDALVPYGDTRIVLRHNNSVVLYDAASKRIVARNRDTDADERSLDLSKCPTCGRPYLFARQDDPTLSGEGVAGDAGPEYFRMLSGSLPNAPSSPVRQLAQPAVKQRSGSSSLDASPSRKGTRSSTSRTRSATYFGETTATGIDPNSFDQGYFGRFFQSSRELGRGGKGVVLLAKHVIDRVDLGWYAIKRIPVGNDHGWLTKILTEVTIMSKLQHENLVQYKHVWLEEVTISNFGPSVPCAFICQAYCNAGDLHHFICGSGKSKADSKEAMKEQHRRKNSKKPDDVVEETGLRRLTLDEIYSFFKQITAGVNYLHENDFVHRDLKPSNCLLHDTGKELKVLVSDFGEVQMGDQVREGTGATGTISYCAPEVLKLDPQTGSLGAFTMRSDVFSLGMVLHFICFGQLPYLSADGIDEEDEDLEQLKDEISKWSGFEDERRLRSDLPDALYQHLSRLLSTNPGHRPSAANILAGLEALGVSGRISGGRSRSTGMRPGSAHSRERSKDGFFHQRRASRVAGVPMERDRSRGSTSGMSASALTHSSNSLRRHVSPQKSPSHSPQVANASFASISGDTAVATEPDSDTTPSSESDQMTSSSYRRDSLILRRRSMSRSGPASPTSPESRSLSNSQSLSQSQPFPQKHNHHQKLITAAGETRDQLRPLPWTWARIRSWTPRNIISRSRNHNQSPYLSNSNSTFNYQQQNPRATHFIKVIVLLGKLLTLYLPCLPSAAEPRLALPLLALALVDFIGPPFDTPLLSLVLALAHLLVLLNGRFGGAETCMRREGEGYGDGDGEDRWYSYSYSY